MAAADPAGFWQCIVNKKDASLLQEAGPRLFTAWAKKDAAAAFAATGLIASHSLRDPLRTLVVESALARDLTAGLALAAQFGPLFTNGYINRALLERDPLGFVQGLTTLPGGSQSFRRFYLRAACDMLAKQNPEAFLTWLESRPREVESLLDNDTFTEGAPMDAARAIAALAAMKPGNARREAMRGAIAIGGAQLPAEEILRLAREHLTGWERNSTVGDAVKTAAKSDLPKAAALLSAMPAGRYVIYAAGEVAGTWAKADWPAAHAWVQSLPDAPVRREAWRAVSSALPPERVPAFAASLATLPQEELSDGLLLNVRKALSKTGPGAVENWLLRMFGHAQTSGIQLDWTYYCSLPGPGEFDDKARGLGAQIVHSPVPIGQMRGFMAALRGELRRGGYDVLHCHHDLLSAVYLAAAAGLFPRCDGLIGVARILTTT